MPSSPAAHSRRKYLRISVRGLIVSVLLIGGWIGWVARSARIQHDVVLAIEKAGGRAGYDWEWKNVHSVRGGKPWAPHWLVKAFGADYFGEVVVVLISIRDRPVDVFAEIGKLSRLQVLHVFDSILTDADLDHLKGLESLRNLQLTWSGPRFRARITDAGFGRLKGLINLEQLGLSGTQVTDAGLASRGSMTKLEKLGLDDTQITDAGLVHLERLNNLSYLDLSGTQITDSGLKHLRPLTKLNLCYVGHTGVTDNGVTALQEVLPGLKIYGCNSQLTTSRGRNHVPPFNRTCVHFVPHAARRAPARRPGEYRGRGAR
jgi:hypothetical protein